MFGKAAGPAGKAGNEEGEGESGGLLGGLNDVLFGTTGPRGGKKDGLVQAMAKSTARSFGTEHTRLEVEAAPSVGGSRSREIDRTLVLE